MHIYIHVNVKSIQQLFVNIIWQMNIFSNMIAYFEVHTYAKYKHSIQICLHLKFRNIICCNVEIEKLYIFHLGHFTFRIFKKRRFGRY